MASEHVEPVLRRSSNRWVPPKQRADAISEADRSLKQIRGLLNKLTVDNYEKVIGQLMDVGLDNKEVLQGLVILLFDKACDEAHFSSLYAVVCKELSEKAPNFDPPENKSGPTFRRLLVKKCQEEFVKRTNIFDEFDMMRAQGVLLSPDGEERRLVMKAKMLGNIKFIGELGKRQLISERILHECIKQLLIKVKDADEDDVECLCKLFETAGQQMDHSAAASYMNAYFDRMQELADDKTLLPRVRFMLQDVIDLRANEWVPRRDNRMRTIGEIRKEAGMDPSKPLGVKRAISPLFSGQQQQGMFSGPRGGGFQMPRDGMQQNGPGGYGGMAGFGGPRYGDQGNRQMNQQQGGNRPGFPALSKQQGTQPRPARPGFAPFPQEPVESSDAGAAEARPQMTELERLRSLQLEAKSKGQTEQLTFRPQMAPLTRAMTPSATSPGQPQQASSGASSQEPLGFRSFVPPPKPKIKKKPRTKEELDRAATQIFEEYIKSRDPKDALQLVTDLENPQYHAPLVERLVAETFERRDTDREALVALLAELCGKEVLPSSDVAKGLKAVIGTLEDQRLDLPKADQYVGVLAARLHELGIVPIQALFNMAAQANCPQVFVEMLAAYTRDQAVRLEKGGDDSQPMAASAAQEAAQAQTKQLLSQTGLDIVTLLPAKQRSERVIFEHLCKAKVDFLMPLLQLENLLAKQLDDDSVSMKDHAKWLEDSLASAGIANDEKMGMMVMRSCLGRICAQSTFIEDLDAKDKGKRELIKFKEYSPMLKKFIGADPKRQLAALYAVQVFCHQHGFPKGFMQRCFMCLYQLEIINDDSFIVWKEDVNEAYEGKGESLFQVNNWLNWLEQLTSEDESSDGE